METKQEVNYKIDWVSSEPSSIQDRKAYFQMLREFLEDVKRVIGDDGYVNKVFEKWNVHFVDVDDFPRVNIDRPRYEKGAI
jgi:hypothetical protein